MARQMKDSGIEWIGEIPKTWITDRLQWHLEEVNVSNSPVQSENILSLTIEAGVIPYEEKGNQGNKSKENYEEYKLAYPDTLVVNSMNIIIGAVGISKYFGCVSPVYYVFKAATGTDLRYIYYLFTNVGFQKEMRKHAKGILEIRLRISSGDIQKLSVPNPEYEEQRRIADFLDRSCTEIDAVMERTKATIEEYKKLKQAVITEAVTKGVRGPRKMKDSGIEWIGEIPEEWEVSRVKYVSDFEPSSRRDDLSDESIITYTPMDCIKNGWFINNTAPLGSVSSSLTAYQEGDIVLAKVTPCFENGNIAIMKGLASGFGLGSSELFVIRAESIDTKYMFYWLRNEGFMQRACATMTGTGGLKRVSPAFVKDCFIHMPPATEQDEIAAYLDEKCAALDTLIAKKTDLLTELETYKKSLIYEYVTGKKEVQ